MNTYVGRLQVVCTSCCDSSHNLSKMGMAILLEKQEDGYQALEEKPVLNGGLGYPF